MTVPTDPESVAMLESLRRAVAQTLERKWRLQQYVVQWSARGPVCIGPDAPPPEGPASSNPTRPSDR